MWFGEATVLREDVWFVESLFLGEGVCLEGVVGYPSEPAFTGLLALQAGSGVTSGPSTL